MYLKTKNPKLSTKLVLGITITLIAIIMSGCSTPTDSASVKPEVKVTVTSTDKVADTISNLASGGTYTIAVTGEIGDDIISALKKALKEKTDAKIALDLSGTTGLKTIDSNVFTGCENLTSIIIPDGVTTIAETAFSDCTNIQSIRIPSSVNKIERAAFSDCNSLTSINIPYGVSELRDYTFMNCNSLTSITIPGSVKTLYAYVFITCNNLKTVIIENGVECLQDNVFHECPSLTSITIPSSVTKIGSPLFGNNLLLKSIIVSGDNPNYSASKDGRALLSKDGKTLISYPSASGNLTIPDGITEIAEKMFYQNKDITSVTIPNSVEKIGAASFASCTNLETVIFQDSCKVTFIDYDAFRYCSNLKTITIPGSVVKIGVRAFQSTSLSNVTFEAPKDWLAAETYDYINGKVISEEDLSDTGKAATCLKSTYSEKYWHK